MTAGESDNFIAVTVIGCQAAMAADGVAIVIHTLESPPVAFGVDLKTIQAFRAALTKAEEFLSQAAGRA